MTGVPLLPWKYFVDSFYVDFSAEEEITLLMK